MRGRPFLGESLGKEIEGKFTLSQGLEAFLLALRVQGRSSQTLALYERSVREFIACLGDQPLDDVTPGDLRRYLAHLAARVKPATVGIRWRSVRAFLNWLYDEGLLPTRVTERVKLPKARTLPRVLSPTEVRALIEAARKRARSWEGKRDYCLLFVFLDTGIRRGEARNLTVHDVHLSQRSLTVRGKTGERVVFFGHKTARALRAWLEARTLQLPGDALFCRRDGYPLQDFKDILYSLADRAGVKRFGCHALRHTFATAFIQGGGDVFALQRLLGHRTLEMTRVYVTLGSQALREAHAKASPVDRFLGS